ncbi:MAG: NADP-dependent oxidoreductase [bacterium]|jgi:NADPH-dependent curcumin reductase CurA|nr:NADP-dependent oxidoreductase [Gammaproteobacteria bacterium]
MATNRRILLSEIPTGKLTEEHFTQDEIDLTSPGEGEVLVRTLILSQDAANRAWMQGATYRSALSSGQVMSSGGIAEVVESNVDRFKVGQIVSGDLGWQEYAVLPGHQLARVKDHDGPLSHNLSLLGVAGLTAYHGLINVPGIHAGEVLLVSAAGGSVGSIVGQIGRIKGAKVIGIAGGTEKCQWVVDELGFDACLDYKDTSAPLRHQLKAVAPDGVDVYFDNTGGDILQTALFAMKLKGRVSCCGAVSMYDGKPSAGPFGVPGLLVTKRLRMEGFIVSDYRDLDNDAYHDLSMWAKQGELKVVEDIIEGLENAPRGLIGLLAGENRGKRMIRVGEPGS